MRLLCLSSEKTSPYAKSFLEFVSKAKGIDYEYVEIEPYVLEKIPFDKVIKHFCEDNKPDFVMSFDRHYRYFKKAPDIPFIEMSDSICGPSRHNRPFVKTPVDWESEVVKVEPNWYDKILPLEDKSIYRMNNSYRYVYLRKIVEEYKANPVANEIPCAFYIPDWNTHTDDILNNIYRYLDFCANDKCNLHVALTNEVLDSNNKTFEEKYKVKRKSIDTTLKIIQEEINKFNKEYKEEGLSGKIVSNDTYKQDLLKYNIRLLSIEPTSTSWLESLYLLKVKGVACNKIRLVFAKGQRFPGTDDFDKEISDVEKYFKDELMRKDRHSTLGQIFTTTDRLYHFIDFQENFTLDINFNDIIKTLESSRAAKQQGQEEAK